MANQLVKIRRNKKDHYYLVDDITINNGYLTFHILDKLYVYEMSFLAYATTPNADLVDCTRLKLVDVIDT